MLVLSTTSLLLMILSICTHINYMFLCLHNSYGTNIWYILYQVLPSFCQFFLIYNASEYTHKCNTKHLSFHISSGVMKSKDLVEHQLNAKKFNMIEVFNMKHIIISIVVYFSYSVTPLLWDKLSMLHFMIYQKNFKFLWNKVFFHFQTTRP